MVPVVGLRGSVALLVPLVLLGALLAGPLGPVQARDGEADELPRYSACVGPAVESAGFRDLRGYSDDTMDAVNCLAHYRITIGTSVGYFSPKDGITRGQMALFLIRAAEPAGIELPAPSDQGFKDIDNYAVSFQEAINQLAEIGVTNGKTPTTYDPDGLVTRRQMAKFLARFLTMAPVGVGGVDIKDVNPDDEVFDDIGDLPQSYYQDVRALYEMGITKGAADDRFHPDRDVTRSQMALFVTRMLAHTNARPAGLTAQAESNVGFEGATEEFVVSVRDRSHRPVTDASVDLFYAPPDVDAFESNGDCDEDELTALAGDVLCEIDNGDETTDEDGNLVYDLPVDGDTILWVWTGRLRNDFDEDTTRYTKLEWIATKPAVAIEATHSLHPAAEKAPFGRRVDFTFQLVDEDGDRVTEEGVEITIRREETVDGRLISRRTWDYVTDPSGRVELFYRVNRPSSADDGDEGLLVLAVLDTAGLDVVDGEGDSLTDDSIRLVWSDEDAEPSALVLEQSVNYRDATSSGRGGRHTVTATLLNQYGDPVRGETIHFVSDDENGLDTDPNDDQMAQASYRKVTNRRGEAVLRYYRDHDQPGIESISAFTEDRSVLSDADDPLLHYWVRKAPTDQALTSLTVRIHDRGRNLLVIASESDGPFVVEYDRSDHFNVDDDTESYASFGDNLDVGDRVDMTIQSHNPGATNSFTRY